MYKINIKKEKRKMKKELIDFKNKDFNLVDMVEKFRINSEYALWLVSKMSDYDIIKIFVGEWDKSMERTKEG